MRYYYLIGAVRVEGYLYAIIWMNSPSGIFFPWLDCCESCLESSTRGPKFCEV